MVQENKVRKTLSVKVGEDFYNEVVNYAQENYMNISILLRKALADAYGLEETQKAREHKNSL